MSMKPYSGFEEEVASAVMGVFDAVEVVAGCLLAVAVGCVGMVVTALGLLIWGLSK